MPASINTNVAALMGAATRASGLLGDATAYHLSTGGRGWRAGLVAECCRSLAIAPASFNRLGAACELVHQASIVHDDVQDEATMRRGQPSVVARSGWPVSICVGDHLLSQAFKLLAPLPCAPSLISLFADRVTEMAAAQAEEFSPTLWSSMTLSCFAGLAAGKAGAMVALAVESAGLLGGLTADDLSSARHAARLLGTAYQAGDDIEDLALDLSRGALNGVIALALDTRDGLEHDGLLTLLARARQNGLGSEETIAHAAQLAPDAARLSTWARDLLDEAVRGLNGHPLAPALTAAARALGARIPNFSGVIEHAA